MGFKNATATGLIIAAVNCAFTLVALKVQLDCASSTDIRSLTP